MILISLLCVLIVVLYVLNKRHNSYWKRRGIPSVDPLLLIGNMLDSVMLRKTLGENIQDIYKKFPGLPYFGLYRFLERIIVIRDANLVKKIFTTDFNHFHDNALDIDEDDPSLMGKNPFLLRGERWKEVRNLVTHAFSSGKIRQVYPLITEVCDDFIKFLTSDKVATEGIEAREACGKFTTDVVASCAFGLKADSLSNPNAVFRQMGNKVFEKSGLNALKIITIFMFPSLSKILKASIVPVDVANFFRQVIKDTIQYRKDNNIIREDFLNSMIQLQDKLTEKKFTLDDITGQSLAFLTDGFETSSFVIAFSLYEIAANKEIQERLRTEIEEAISHHNGQITYDSLIDMQYLESIVYETLRKYSAGPALFKLCTQEYTLPPLDGGSGPGFTISPGMVVGIPLFALQRDPENFPNPLKYDPDRHRDEEAKQRFKNAFYPFGDGPRVCLGMRFAVIQAKACIANLVLKLDIRLAEKMKEPVILEPKAFIPAAKHGLWLTFHPRQ